MHPVTSESPARQDSEQMSQFLIHIPGIGHGLGYLPYALT
jgi:hypothetical protein